MSAPGLIAAMWAETRAGGLARAGHYLCRALMREKLAPASAGHIAIRDHWGEWQIGRKGDHGEPPGLAVRLRVHDPAFYMALCLHGGNGAANAYRRGLWSCSSLETLFRILIANRAQMDGLEQGPARLAALKDRLSHLFRANTRRGSRRNIQDHYDLGNDLFRLFLDESMTYSAGVFRAGADDLYQASIAKLDLICRKLDLRPEHHVIEIGSGWGSFAIHAARHYGCRVTSTTISRQQYDLAKERVEAAGLGERVEILLRDYRDLRGQYDRCVSIEMIEAVGHGFLAAYFGRCAALLKPDGQMCLQAITMPDQRYAAYLRAPDFIQRFIFPGSCVPSPAALAGALAGTDLKMIHLEDYAPHYARTLRLWLGNFKAAADRVYGLGYSRDFYRLWAYYLEYCAAGFAERYLGLLQIVLNKPACRRALVHPEFNPRTDAQAH